ncbi:MAG TPA: hypothetical protein VL096_13360, partial [Pirellulaceae bacterium]|nr:hypothetical protein [Pirellulaceae bacterium]
MKRRPTFRARRGVVLMVILSLLVLFALLGVTFAIVAGQYRKAASSFSRRDQYGDEPGRQLDSAMYMVLRDTPNPRNPIRSHSLLTDIYGLHSDPSLGGVVIVKGALASGLTSTAQNQFLEFRVTPSGWPANAANAGYFNGCVLTFTSGKLQGVSTRVVGYGVDGGVGVFRVLRPTMDDANLEVAGVGTWATGGDTVLINGRAFSGTGAGYNTATGKLDATDAINGGLLALSPNRTGNPTVAVGSPGGPDANSSLGSMTGYLAGGANEPYDAPDFQNMHMAAIIPDHTNPTGHGVKLDASGRPQIIPSFHRPALLQNQGVKASTIFRPMPGITASANFPVPGATFDPFYGPWDVDNDGDGLNDSIWMDLDFPMQTSSSGRAYKPLFAIMCLDMDGRLNINYQGNFQQVTTSATAMADLPLAGGTLTSTIPTRGAGLGPGEVNLKLGWGLNDVEYQQLLEGNNPIYGRYGSVTAGQTVPTPGGAWDALDITRFYEIPSSFFDFYNAIGSYSSYQSPSDLQGQLVTGVDHRGQLQTSIPTDT